MCDKKDSNFGAKHNWLLHHDVPAHMFLKTIEFVTNNMVIIPHSLYLPELAPVILLCFPN
jgi:hypothetical protein